MEALLKQDASGVTIEGSEQQLLAAAARGDDLTIFIESQGYDEYIIFDNYAVGTDRISALSLQHIDHGDLRTALDARHDTLFTSQYIYDSKARLVLSKQALDTGDTLNQAIEHDIHYRSYTWYSSRTYTEALFSGRNGLVPCGDQFKLRLEPALGFAIVIKPDIVYFPNDGRDYLVKSSQMLLPLDFVRDPHAYLQAPTPLTESRDFAVSYLNVSSDNQLTIVYTHRATADVQVTDRIREGRLARKQQGPTSVTCFRCRHTILVPRPCKSLESG